MSISLKPYEKTLGLFLLILMPLALPMAMISLYGLLPVSLDSAQMNFGLFLVNFLLTVGIFRSFLWKNLRQSLRKCGKTFLWFLIGFILYAGSSFLVDWLIGRLVPDFANANDASIQSQVHGHFWLMFISTVLFAPIIEETLYRGLVFGLLRSKSRWAAYLVSAVAFSAMHLINYLGALSPLHLLLSFIQYLPSGFALALAFDHADSLWASILIHMSVNLIAILTVR